VVNQNYPSVEMILVYDRISKNAEKAISDYCKTVDLPTIVKETTHPGIVTALNLGVKSSTGKFIARLDSDDIMAPERLSIQIKHFLEDPNLVILGSQIKFISESNEFIRQSAYPTYENAIRNHFVFHNPIAHPSVMFRSDIFEKVGGYREFSAGAEDYDLWLRMSQFGSVKNLNQVLTYYRRSSQQETVRNFGKQLHLDSIVRIENQDLILYSNVGTFLDSARLDNPLSSVEIQSVRNKLMKDSRERSFRNFRVLTSSELLNRGFRIKKCKSTKTRLIGLIYLFAAFVCSPLRSFRLIAPKFSGRREFKSEN